MSKVLNNVSLADFTSYKIGGPALYFAEISSAGDLKDVVSEWKNLTKNLSEKKVFILGGGTNVLFNDSGYEGLVIHNKIQGIKILEETDMIKLKVGAGVLIKDLIDFCIEHNLSGLEWAGGLPGTLGGGIRGNAGAFGGEIKDIISGVSSINVSDFSIIERDKEECKFGYRQSVFKGEATDEVILEAVLTLRRGKGSDIEKSVNEKIQYRRERHPSLEKEPNAGSTFKNIPTQGLPDEVINEFRDKIKKDPFPVLPVVKLIAGAGLTGVRVGGIEVSSMHPNYLVNKGSGRAWDVLGLIDKIKEKVFEKYRVKIEEEVTVIN